MTSTENDPSEGIVDGTIDRAVDLVDDMIPVADTVSNQVMVDFDILTSPTTSERIQAVAAAVLLELPLAGVCLWLSYHTQEIAEQRLRLLLRRQPRQGVAGSRADHRTP